MVQAFDAKPSIRIKASDQPSVPFRKYGFVDAVEELDPIGSLGLLDPDFKVIDLFVNFKFGLFNLTNLLQRVKYQSACD